MSYENILVETRGKVGLITLNRPQAMNALFVPWLGHAGLAPLGFDACR